MSGPKYPANQWKTKDAYFEMRWGHKTSWDYKEMVQKLEEVQTEYKKNIFRIENDFERTREIEYEIELYVDLCGFPRFTQCSGPARM